MSKYKKKFNSNHLYKPVAVAITCELLDLFNMFNEFISYGKNGIIRGENGMNQDPLLKR